MPFADNAHLVDAFRALVEDWFESPMPDELTDAERATVDDCITAVERSTPVRPTASAPPRFSILGNFPGLCRRT
jgi:hypothetical protein